jgi:flagellar protein FlaJ
MPLGEIAFRIFGRFTRKKKHYGLQENLRKARMPTSADIYAATAMFSAVLVCIPGFVLGFLMGWLFGLDLPFMLMLIVLFPAVFAALTYQLTLSYPRMVASERGRKIDAALPYTIGFMHALSRGGATIVDIFRELSTRTDVGELQAEAQAFMRDIEYLGRDPLTALRGLARTTPSVKFKSFIEVLISIIETGGDVTPYFSTKVFEFQNVLKEDNKKTILFLEFMAELYVILVFFMPLLFLTIIIFMGLMPGMGVDIRIIWAIVYGWIPLGSVIFAIMISTTTQVQIGGRARVSQLPSPYRGVSLTKGDARDRALLQRLGGTLWRVRLKRFLANPFRVFMQFPSYVLLFSVPAATIYLTFLTPVIDTSAIFITFLIAALPYTIAYEFRSQKVGKIEAALPDFLKSLSSASRSGLTLPRALAVTSTSELGLLTDEIRRVHKDIQWGSSASEALARMEQRTGICATAARATTLVRKASEADENISDVVDIIMNDVETQRVLRKERNTAMFIYRIVIIVSFVVFLFTAYVTIDSFLIAGVEPPPGITLMELKLAFYHLLLINGVAAGLIAAQIGGGDLGGGLKYALAMALVVWIIFTLVIIPAPVRPPPIPEEEWLLALLAL